MSVKAFSLLTLMNTHEMSKRVIYILVINSLLILGVRPSTFARWDFGTELPGKSMDLW